MKSPLRTAAQALLVVLLAGTVPRTAHAYKDYQMMVYFVNAPWGADLAALMTAETLFQGIIQWLLTCEILGPGNAPTRRNRELAEQPLDGSIPTEGSTASNGGGLEFVATGLRGGAGGTKVVPDSRDRDLVEISCPTKCSNSGSTKCQSLGCAYCGRCRRDLQTTGGTSSNSTNTTADFTLTSTNALKIENWLNDNLKGFCLFKFNCKIYAKIYRLLPDGTTIPLTG